MTMTTMGRMVCACVVTILACCSLQTGTAQGRYDLVIRNGRVMDPESGLDAVRNVGIRSGRIVALSDQHLDGNDVIDAAGFVVAPGFIDLHEHGQEPRNYEFQAHDGVTTSLELEI
ncbi:MAG TPA: hypothetical protein VFS57_08360, partial [Gemmatimonadaceae bacterium]|nr:hypothetical protein [Gemmatimonadaceae bacterium]